MATQKPRRQRDHAAEYRQKVERYNRERAELIDQLGGKCVDCGTTERLEFDHTEPHEWEIRKFSRWSRLNKYRRDIEAGVIVIRCRRCNARKGYPVTADELAGGPEPGWTDPEPEPWPGEDDGDESTDEDVPF